MDRVLDDISDLKSVFNVIMILWNYMKTSLYMHLEQHTGIKYGDDMITWKQTLNQI